MDAVKDSVSQAVDPESANAAAASPLYDQARKPASEVPYEHLYLTSNLKALFCLLVIDHAASLGEHATNVAATQSFLAWSRTPFSSSEQRERAESLFLALSAIVRRPLENLAFSISPLASPRSEQKFNFDVGGS